MGKTKGPPVATDDVVYHPIKLAARSFQTLFPWFFPLPGLHRV